MRRPEQSVEWSASAQPPRVRYSILTIAINITSTNSLFFVCPFWLKGFWGTLALSRPRALQAAEAMARPVVPMMVDRKSSVETELAARRANPVAQNGRRASFDQLLNVADACDAAIEDDPVAYAVSHNGRALAFASEGVRADKAVAILACKNDGSALGRWHFNFQCLDT